jgi:hypothetical protein
MLGFPLPKMFLLQCIKDANFKLEWQRSVRWKIIGCQGIRLQNDPLLDADMRSYLRRIGDLLRTPGVWLAQSFAFVCLCRATRGANCVRCIPVVPSRPLAARGRSLVYGFAS